MSMEAAVSSDRFDEVMGLEIEPELGNHRPVFIHDYPAKHGALARLKPGEPAIAERFELYVGGMEICNAFSELVDPKIQRRRFAAEQALRASLGKPLYPLPEPFLNDLAKTPPAAGCALGMDRLAMLFANAPDIAHVTAFAPEDL